MNSFEQLAAAAQASGQQSYSGWNKQLYERLCQESGGYFWAQSGKDVTATQSYLSLLSEGVGRGHVTQAANPEYHQYFARAIKWRCLLEYWLVMEIPRQIADVARTKRIPLLAKLWNLGENILRDQCWIDPFVLKQALQSSPRLEDIERQLRCWLDPLLREPQRARWKPPFDVEVVDGREIHDGFLPGQMVLTAPAVVCVADRRLDNVFGGIFLHEQRAQHIFHHSHLGSYPQPGSIEVRFAGGGIDINGHSVSLPSLNKVHSHIVCASGVVVISAVDSQRLWLVRCQ